MVQTSKSLILICTLAISMAAILLFAAYGNRPVTVTVDGHLVSFIDQEPIIVNNRVLVPVRGVFEHMGFEATWDSRARMARLEKDGIVVIIPAGTSAFFVNDTIITPDVPQQLVNDRMLLPLRAIAEAIGGSAVWDGTNRIARITSLPSGRVDIRPLLGWGDNVPLFNEVMHLFGNQTSVEGEGLYTMYTFDTGIRVGIASFEGTFDSIRPGQIHRIHIDYRELNSISAFHFRGIDGTSTYDDVVTLFGVPDYISIGDTIISATKFYRYWYDGAVAFFFDTDGMVVAIALFLPLH